MEQSRWGAGRLRASLCCCPRLHPLPSLSRVLAPPHLPTCPTLPLVPPPALQSFREITEDLCGALSVQQLYRISTMYWDDR